MATIYNTVETPGGAPLRHSDISVQLSSDPDAGVPRVPDDEVVVRRTHTATTDDEGYWEMDSVIPNSEIEPSGTVYKITEADYVYYVSVPDAATPVFWIGDILVDTPEWEDS